MSWAGADTNDGTNSVGDEVHTVERKFGLAVVFCVGSGRHRIIIATGIASI